MYSSVIEAPIDRVTQDFFFSLQVQSAHHDPVGALIVTLEVPPDLLEEFRFVQGQHLTLRAMIDGREVRRSYSICSAAGDRDLCIAIKQAANGLFSGWAAQTIKAGSTVEVMPPVGHFYVPLSAASRRHYVAFAAGSGITPLLSIIRTTLAVEPLSHFTLFYGNRSSESILFRDELADLKDTYLARFSLAHILSRETQDCELFNGRITPGKCKQLLAHVGALESIDMVFLCGPQAMSEAVATTLKELGIEDSRIKQELFSAAPPRRRLIEKTARGAGECDIRIVSDGRERTFTMSRQSEESILDVALARGVALRYSCKSGVCATCRSKVVEGRVEMAANYALEPDEVRLGFVLTCQSYPASEHVKLDFDKDN